MTVFVWTNEHGEWMVTHLPPADNSAYVRVVLSGESAAAFFSQDGEILDMEVRV